MTSSNRSRHALIVVFAYFGDLVVSLVILGGLYLAGFRMSNISTELFAAIFTVVISSATVLLNSITGNQELMSAAEQAGRLSYLMSAFSVPIVVSLVGLISAIVASSFQIPHPFLGSYNLGSWILVILVIYAAVGFLAAILINVYLQYTIAVAYAQKYSE